MAVELRYDDGLATVVLGRPHARNALDEAMVQGLADVAAQLGADADLRALLLRADGTDFGVGGDIRAFAANRDRLPEYLAETAAVFHGAILQLAQLEVPVVCAVQGNAAGGGLALACVADLVVAARSARFTLAYTRIGLSADGGVSWFLTRRVGRSLALDLMLTNRTLDAESALAAGLADRVVDDADLVTEATALARALADGPTPAFAACKRLVGAAATSTLAEQLDLELATITELAGSSYARAAVDDFLARRPRS